jgi:hypothetical protein
LEGPQDDVEKCLHQSSSLQKVNFLGQSTLHFAVARPQYLKSLLEAGFDINVRDHYGSMLQKYAAATGNTNIALQLLAAGPDMYSEEEGWLEHASRLGHWELVMARLHQILSSSTYCKRSLQNLLDNTLAFWTKYRKG